MPAESVGEFLRGMDSMLTISTHETFSQAIVQGMLTGLPIIASDLPVYLEKLDPLPVGRASSPPGAELRRGGFIARSPQEIAAAMMALAEDTALRSRLGAEGRRIALDRYIWDTKRFVREHLFPE
jgi:glycosyltransferase involved in cell wall biosynthesis